MFWAVLTAVWGISWASRCFIGWTWKWALVGLKTACLVDDRMRRGVAAVMPFILLVS